MTYPFLYLRTSFAYLGTCLGPENIPCLSNDIPSTSEYPLPIWRHDVCVKTVLCPSVDMLSTSEYLLCIWRPILYVRVSFAYLKTYPLRRNIVSEYPLPIGRHTFTSGCPLSSTDTSSVSGYSLRIWRHSLYVEISFVYPKTYPACLLLRLGLCSYIVIPVPVMNAVVFSSSSLQPKSLVKIPYMSNCPLPL